MKIKLKSIITAAVTAFVTVIQPLSANAADVSKNIIITTAEELAAITGNNSYCIVQNIDLEGFDWKGISDFSGTLSSRDQCVIKNLNSDSCGLFKKLSSGAKISNIHIENANIITNTKKLGGIVSYIPSDSEQVKITNCSVNGKVSTLYSGPSARSYCGGIAGVVATKDCVISNCSSNARVGGVRNEGGIVGLNYGEINNCVFTGKIYNANNYDLITEEELYYINFITGGISGVNYGNIESCSVLHCFCDEAEYMGHISGVNIKGKGTIKECFVLGSGKDLESQIHENYNLIANTLSSKTFSKKLKL